MLANPPGAPASPGWRRRQYPGSSSIELGQSIVAALLGHASTAPDQSPQLRGKPYFDNHGVVYTGALPPDVLTSINTAIDRFDAVPSVLNYQERYYQPTGGLEIPTLTLSLSRDPVAPDFHRTFYASVVAAAGETDHLVQRTVDRYGHCDQLTPVEIGTAFRDLVAWVEYGVKPVRSGPGGRSSRHERRDVRHRGPRQRLHGAVPRPTYR